ncbi:MAG: DUF4430 domain-containing protein [Actinomycetia bacterium]|nr:DUF4430 domain-containing protein [Actinomycetes bacterium]
MKTVSTKKKVVLITGGAVLLVLVGGLVSWSLGWFNPAADPAGVSAAAADNQSAGNGSSATAQQSATDGSAAEQPDPTGNAPASADNAISPAANSTDPATDAVTSADPTPSGGTSPSSGSTNSNSGGGAVTPPSSSNPPANDDASSTPPPAPEPPPPATISVSVYIDASAATSLGFPATLASQTVTLSPGASVYDALRATGVAVGGSSDYVRSIGGLAEFAGGPTSGWRYSVNGATPGYSCGSYRLSGGERIVWTYSTN